MSINEIKIVHFDKSEFHRYHNDSKVQEMTIVVKIPHIFPFLALYFVGEVIEITK